VDRRPLPRTDRKRVERKVPHGVLVGDLVDLLVGERGELQLVDLGTVGPRAVRVRKVRLPTDVLDIELVNEAHTYGIIDEAAENPLLEHISRPHGVRESLPRPARVALLNVLSPLEEIRDPPDVTLREREHQIGKAPPEIGPQQIAQRVDRHHRRESHRHRGGCVCRGRRGLGRRTDVQAQDCAHVRARSEEGIPVT